LQSVVDDAVAVLVGSVAGFGLRSIAAGPVFHRDAGTREGYRLGVTNLHAVAVTRSGKPTRDVQADAIVGDAVTIIVATIADFTAGHASGANTIINDAVAIIVLAVARFGHGAVLRIAATGLSLVNRRVAVVVDVVADFSRIVAKPSRGGLSLSHGGARQ
jgi:hypothetical protein